jgi:sirohydrochlorin cobaltochelatase
VLPLFLGAGGHVRKDLPVLMATLAAAHPAVHWQLRNAVGESDAVIEAMATVALAHAQTPG